MFKTEILDEDFFLAKVDCDHIDTTNSTDFYDDLMNKLPVKRHLILDLEAVEFIDSSGLGKILAVSRQLFESGRKIYLTCPQSEVQVLFEMVHIDQLIPVKGSVDEVLKNFHET